MDGQAIHRRFIAGRICRGICDGLGLRGHVMSIDARIAGVTRRLTGEVTIALESRDGRSGPGQEMMTILNPSMLDCDMAQLIGCEVWGGSSDLMLGDRKLADRDGYLGLILVGGWLKIVAKWHEERCDKAKGTE